MPRFLMAALLMLGARAMSQIVENPPFNMFTEFPQAESRGFGIGSLGFDAPINTYNPHYRSLDDADYYFFLGGNVGFTGQRTFPLQNEIPLSPHPEKLSSPIIPTFGIVYTTGQLMLQLCYYQDYSLNAHEMTRQVTYIFLNNHSVTSTERDISIQQNTLQAAFSMNISPVSLTAAMLTKHFRYEWDIKAIPPVVHGHDLLDHFQLFFGLMMVPNEDLRGYLSFTSQNSRVDLSDGGYVFSSGTLVYPGATQVSYYGNIGYGAQVAVIPQLKVSVEMRHQFLEDDGRVDLPGRSIINGERHIWNNEITLGTHLSLLDDLKLGLRHSRFLRYDNRKGMIHWSFDGSYQRMSITSPYSIVFTSELTLGVFSVEGLYQYSKSEYEYRGHPVISDAVHSASILVGYALSIEE